MADITPRFVTVKEVRQISGITDSEINDDDIRDMINDKELEIEKRLNTIISPQVIFNRLDGTNTNTIFTRRSPLLAVRAINSNGTDITLSNISFERSGRVRLDINAEQTIFSRYPSFNDSVNIKYLVGMLEFPTRGGVETDTDVASTVGTSVALSVTSSASFKIDDWVNLEGIDGNYELAQITALPDATTITVDELVYSHVSGSLVRKLIIPKEIKEYIKLEVALMLFGREVGQSFDDITGYSLSELQVQKGEPFTQWREAYRQNIERWKTLGKTVRNRVSMRIR